MSRLQRTIGNQAVQSMLNVGVIQAKLKIGPPNDRYEQEADRIAEQVISIPASAVSRAPSREAEKQIQSKPLAAQITSLGQRQYVHPMQRFCTTCAEEYQAAEAQQRPVDTGTLCPKCGVEREDGFERTAGIRRGHEQFTPFVQLQSVEEKEEGEIQRKETEGRSTELPSVVESRINTLLGGGQPLPASARDYYGARFGYDFRDVRVHTSDSAAEAARSVSARAFTIGQDVVFGAGQYQPTTLEGKRLIAHELTHVIQQQGHVAGAGLYLQRVPWGPFEIDGAGDLAFEGRIMGMLRTLQSTAQGKNLFQEIENRRGWRRVRIAPHRVCHAGGRRSIGFNLSGCVDTVRDRCSGEAPNPPWMSRAPRSLYLFRECALIYLSQRGLGRYPESECRATGVGHYFNSIAYNENRLRCELGIPVRPCFGSYQGGRFVDVCHGMRGPTCPAGTP